jgi:4'-phosphopantetheinyl transferase
LLAFSRFDPTAVTRADPIAVGSNDVHLWAFTLDEPDATVDAWLPLLSDAERLRADRFVRHRDRRHWIVAHGVLRHLLGRYCGIDPREVAFDHGSAGKPQVAARAAQGAPPAFNLAHAHGRALLAVARGGQIGVDLEPVRDDFDPLPIARQFFFGAELAAIQSAPAGLRRDAFFRHWVAKEAVLKAHGSGLSLPLDSFCVTFETGDSVARVDSRHRAILDSAWLVRMLPLEAPWRGAVAASGEGWTLRFAT